MAGVETICLVDEEHLADSFVHCALGFLGGLTNVTAKHAMYKRMGENAGTEVSCH